MKNERILIYTDTHKSTDFENSIEVIQQGTNDLINIFESFQSYKKIKSQDDFEQLVQDPLSMFDEVLQVNVDFKESGGKKGNPAIIAKLFDIDRDNYILVIKGQKIVEGTCKPCSKLKIKQTGKGVINYFSYQQYQQYLIFDQGHFSIDENAVEQKKESFNYYAESEKEINTYKFWHECCDMLNELSKRGLLGEPNAFSKLLGGRITYSFQAYKFSVDEQSLANEIQSLKS
jgi:hypothetical protein